MIKSKTIILLYIFTLFFTACGKKAPPVAPGTVLPNPPEDLSYELKEDGLMLIIKLPEKNDDGSDFKDYKGIEVYKAIVTEMSSFCPKCDEKYRLIYEGKPEVSKGYVSFTDDTVLVPALYYYKVRVLNKNNTRLTYEKGLSRFSAPVKVSLDTAK